MSNARQPIDLKRIAGAFGLLGSFESGAPYGSGHINDTFALVYDQGGRPIRYILQRVNENVFKNGEALMANIRRVTAHQPAKLAAFEGQFATEAGAPFRLGGIVDLDRRRLDYAIEIPYALSLMLYLDPTATVTGLDSVPRDQWPPVAIARGAFQVMILCGGL